MKKIFTQLFLIAFSITGFAQIQIGELYQLKTDDAIQEYILFSQDGKVSLLEGDIDSEVARNLISSGDEKVTTVNVVLKEGIKGSFVIQNNGKRINCMIHAKEDQISVTRMGPGIKVTEIYTLIK